MKPDTLLIPGRRLLERLPFIRKFLLVGALFLMPLVALLSTLVLLQTEDIERARKERGGIRLMMPLRQIVQAVQIHRGASQIVIGGRPEAIPRADDAAKRVSEGIAALSALEAAQPRQFDRYGLRGLHAGIGTAWENIRSKAVTLSSAESLELHSALIRNLLGYIADVADKTGLSLDPEMETSHLALTLYDHLPNAAESAGVMRALGSRALTLGAMTAGERIQVHLLLDSYRQSMARATTSFDKSIAGNSAVTDKLRASFDGLTGHYEVYSGEIRNRLLEVDKPTGDPAAYFETATRAIDAIFVLWDNTVEQLDSRIEQRIERLRQGLLINVLIAVVAVGLAIYLFIAFMQSVNREIAIILEGTDRMARGDFDHAIVSDLDDEIGEICRRLDHVRIQLVVHIELDRQATEEKAVREAAEQSNLRLRTILDNLGEGIYVLDPEGRLTYLNAAGEAMLGWRFDELEGQVIHNVIHHHTPDGQPLPASACPIHLAMREKRPYRSDNELFFTRDDTPLPVAVTGAPLLLEDNRQGSVAAFRDMRAQRALIDKMAEAQDKLHAAKEQAESAARMKSEFLSMMSHEIRTPLNGVIGMTDLLLDTSLDAEQQELATLAKASAQHLLAVINDILDFSKIEAGKFVIECIPFDFQPLLESSVNLVASKAREKGLALSFFIDPSLPERLTGDPVRLRQILINFLGNAVKFTAQGRIDVRAVREEDLGGEAIRVRMEVSDSGIGIPPEVLPHLFKPFSQADASTTRKYGGTGLGLSICKRLAELMGGEVGVTSESGQGSTFWLRLDLAPAAPDSAPTAASSSPLAPAPETHDGIRILLAEDNVVNQKVAARLLDKLGYHVDIANDGQEAMNRWQTGDYALILMDVQMPRMDGFEATRAIRDQEMGGQRHTPIVAMTANAMSGDREKCLAGGMDDYLPKPIDPAQLRTVLEAWLPATGRPMEMPPATEIAPELPSPFDMARLKEFFGDDEETVTELMSIFSASLPALKQRMSLALRERNATLKGVAHELKGSSGNIGATELARLAARLETLIAAMDWPGAEEIFAAIETEAERVETFVRHRPLKGG